ncbi:MAG: hypothetical protein A2020_01045 [Lentisphaerae bacterium GWF2_45_14]|nr:MAG: hypothetical protein A2020_01045 [Lentisphaerae bacterium GWF2_45_14]
METVLIAFILMTLSGILLGCIIGAAAKFFFVKSDPRIEDVNEMLPGANCGGCGKAGCSDLARAIVAGECVPGSCPVCSLAVVGRIAAYLGVDAGSSVKKAAVVFCGGSNSKARKSVNYNGINDCISASLIAGGPKDCRFGCMGLASCARVCPFNAIEVIDGLACVHSDICTGCGKCIESCPRKLIRLVPETAPFHVYCNSPEKGVEKKKNCDVACIACRKCLKAAGEDQMKIEGFLAQVNYDNMPGADVIEKAACPTSCISSPENHFPGTLKKENAAR